MDDELDADRSNDAQIPTIIVNDPPTFTFAEYIKNYDSHSRIRLNRLFLIARSCPPLRVDALKAAIDHARLNEDADSYTRACDLLENASSNDPHAKLDQDWVSKIKNGDDNQIKSLKEEIENPKTRGDKTRTFQLNESLVNIYLRTGKLQKASMLLFSMISETNLPFATQLSLTVDLCRLSLCNRQWDKALERSLTATSRNWMDSSKSRRAGDYNEPHLVWLTACEAISKLALGRFVNALEIFTKVWDDKSDDSCVFRDISSMQDIATYWGLCALACMSRTELENLMERQSFQQAMQLQPDLRRAFTFFLHCQYKDFLKALDSHKADYLLDIYLQAQVDALFSRIRRNCIKHFMEPFSRVKLDFMRDQLGQGGVPIVKEVANLIESGAINARINSVDGVVVVEPSNKEDVLVKKTVSWVNNYTTISRAQLFKLSVLSAGLSLTTKPEYRVIQT